MRLFSLDPGLRASGCSDFLDGRLTACALARSKDSGTGEPDVLGAEEVSKTAAEWFASRAASGPPVDLFVIEWPKVRRARSKKDPNDLLLLTLVNGLVLTAIREFLPAVVVAPVLADDWTKGIPKEVRQAQFLARSVEEGGLTDEEKALLEASGPPYLQHNTLDAINLGKWASFPARFASLLRASTRGARLDETKARVRLPAKPRALGPRKARARR